VLTQRRHILRDEPVFLVPSERAIVAQSVLLVVFSSWFVGGVWSTTQNWILGFTLLGLPALRLRYRETGRVSFRAFLPALLWIGFTAIAISNPSHAPGAAGGWVPRTGWIHWLPTTADIAHTLADARVWLAALLQAALVSAVVRTPAAARRIWIVIALNGFALAAIGACFHFAGATQVLGLIDPPEKTYFFATFFYKNHWAAYGALTATAAFTLALQFWRAALAGDHAARGKTLFFACAGLLTAITLPLPGSRAGVIMAAALVALFFATMTWTWWRSKGGSRAQDRWAMAFGAVVAAGIVAFGVNAYAHRAAYDLERTTNIFDPKASRESPALRLLVSRDTWRMALKRPWFGWGPGCFEIVFPVFQGRYLRGPDGRPLARFEFAHNDWLQLPAEAGLLGAALLIVPVGLLARRAWRGADAAGRFGLLGCALIAAHAWIDFPLHNPAVLLTWVILLGTAHRLRAPPD
jgi:O-antigen ligase